MSSPPTPLGRLLAPRSIAAIGGGWAERVVEQCQKMGFAGEVWPVHPSKDEVRGVKCFRSVAELPGAPDASFVAVNRKLAVAVIGDLAKRGAGGAICFASGFKEAGAEGAELERALVAASGDMPFLGPNCYGLINYVDGALLWPDQHGGERVKRGVAILMQSGNIAINMTMNQRGLPIAYLAALGNQAKVGLAELTMALAATGRVSAIGLLIEGIPDAVAFADAVVAARLHGVGIVALKAGRSEAGRELAMSHTGSLAGSDAVMEALLARLGVARVNTLPDFLETLKLLHVFGPLPGKDIVSLSCSGGEALLMADAATGRDVRFRPFTASDVARIRPTVNPIVNISNPFDYHTFDWGKFDRLETTFTEVLKSQFDLGLIVMDIPRADRCDGTEWKLGIDAFAAAGKAAGARIGVVATLNECMPEDYARELMARGIAPMMGIDATLTAIDKAAFIGRTKPRPALLLAPGHSRSGSRPPGNVWLSEWEAKLALAAFGLDVPDGRLVTGPAEARAAFAELGGPVAVKACSRALLHKTEAGAVRLNVGIADDAAAAVQAMAGLAQQFIIERMVENPIAELIVGINWDPQVGLVLVVGSGGVLVELVGDAVTLLLPVSAKDVRAAILSLKTGKLLAGFRGRAKGDVEAAVAAVLAVARYAEANAHQLLELDVNPLIVRPEGKGAIAVDALIRLAQPAS
jgi:acetate---CoA ligase (ADP-forming)